MAKLVTIGRNIIIRKTTQELKSSGGIVLTESTLDENITGTVMALPEHSYHPDGSIRPHVLSVGDEVCLMRGRVGTTLPARHLPDEYKSDDKELWLSVSEEFVLYKLEG